MVSDAVVAAFPDKGAGRPICRDFAQSWARHPAQIVGLEARALKLAMKRVCADAASMNTHHLFLCDNMAVTLSFVVSEKVLEIVDAYQKVTSLAMSMGIRLHVRWVPSEQAGRCAKQKPGCEQVPIFDISIGIS